MVAYSGATTPLEQRLALQFMEDTAPRGRALGHGKRGASQGYAHETSAALPVPL